AIPGMEEEVEVHSEKVINKNTSLHEESLIIIEALGGKENIESVEACATRLRVAVTNGEIIQKQTIKDTGATAVFEVKGGIQAVFGGKADLLSQEINQILGKDN
ncbi:TPA: PTS transporter subunit EIIB, partial [Enterococcus faecium]